VNKCIGGKEFTLKESCSIGEAVRQERKEGASLSFTFQRAKRIGGPKARCGMIGKKRLGTLVFVSAGDGGINVKKGGRKFCMGSTKEDGEDRRRQTTTPPPARADQAPFKSKKKPKSDGGG